MFDPRHWRPWALISIPFFPGGFLLAAALTIQNEPKALQGDLWQSFWRHALTACLISLAGFGALHLQGRLVRFVDSRDTDHAAGLALIAVFVTSMSALVLFLLLDIVEFLGSMGGFTAAWVGVGNVLGFRYWRSSRTRHGRADPQ